MSESSLWRLLNDEMSKDLNWDASRVESHALSAGIPDVDYCYYGDGHIELKYGNVNRKMPEIRPTQIRWLCNRAAVGGKVLLLTALDDQGDYEARVYLFHPGSFALQLSMNRNFEYWFNNRINDIYWKLDPIETRKLLQGERQ